MEKEDLASEEYTAYTGKTGFTEHSVDILAYLDPLYEEEKIKGFMVRIIQSADDADAEELHLEKMKHIPPFPFIWINVTYEKDVFTEEQKEAFQKKFKLKIFC